MNIGYKDKTTALMSGGFSHSTLITPILMNTNIMCIIIPEGTLVMNYPIPVPE